MKRWIEFSIGLILLLLAGCVTSDSGLNSYVDPIFNLSQINKIALFPMENSDFSISEERVLDTKVITALHSKNPEIEIMSSYTTINLLNAYNLTQVWSNYLYNYDSSGLQSKHDLFLSWETLKIDAILFGEIVGIHKVDGRDVLYAIDGVHGGNQGMTKVTVKYRMLSTNTGKIVWESTSDGIKKTREIEVSAPPVIDAVNLAVDVIFKNLPVPFH